MFRAVVTMGVCALLNLTSYAQDDANQRKPRTTGNRNWNRDQMETVEVAFFGAYVEKASLKQQKIAKILEGTGVIARITENGPAGKQGLKSGDLIYKLDDQILINRHQFQVLIANYPVGTTITVVHCRDGKEMTTKLTLGKKEVRRWKDPKAGVADPVRPPRAEIEKALPNARTTVKKIKGEDNEK